MLSQMIVLYDRFLTLFPSTWAGPISLILLVVVVGFIWHAIRKSGVWLLLAIVLIPTLIPILKGLGQAILTIVRSLLERASI